MRARYAYPLAVLSGVVLSLPFTDVSVLPAWFGLAPMFYLVAEAPSRKRAAGLASVFALVWNLLAFRFFNHLAFGGWIALSVYTSLFYLASLLAVRELARRGTVSAIFGTAAVWTIVELARSRIPVFAFPWLLLGHATEDHTHLRQLADLFGVYGLSFLVAAVNAVLAYVAAPVLFGKLSAPPGSPLRRRVSAAWVAVLVLAALLYGAWRVSELKARIEPGLRIAMIQGCTYQKVSRTDEEKQTQLDEHIAMHAKAAQGEAGGGGPPALICWAETMVPGAFNVETYAIKFARAVREHGIPTVFGSDWIHPDDKEIGLEDQRWYNTAFFMTGDGKLAGRYAKRRLVPFGEYIPFTETLPFLTILRSVTRDSYRPGAEPSPVFETGGVRFAFNVCIEDAHPDLAREAARDGADVLMNITNDGWFHGTFGPAAHLQAARFRAIEVRRPLVRVTNSGVDAIVDPLGDLSVPIPPDKIGVAFANLPLLKGGAPATPYEALGELGVFGLTVAILLLSLYLDKRTSS